MRLSQFESKYKATIEGAKEPSAVKPKVIFAPDVAKFKKELFGAKKSKESPSVLDPSTDKYRKRGYNDVLIEKKETPISSGICLISSYFQLLVGVIDVLF